MEHKSTLHTEAFDAHAFGGLLEQARNIAEAQTDFALYTQKGHDDVNIAVECFLPGDMGWFNLVLVANHAYTRGVWFAKFKEAGGLDVVTLPPGPEWIINDWGFDPVKTCLAERSFMAEAFNSFNRTGI